MSTPASTAALVVSGVRFGYRTPGGRREVLRGVDLSVGVGEGIALLGTNGSGKTTLLRIIAGSLSVDAGWVELFGRPLAAWSRIELARRVAVLPQSLELPGGFRVAEIVQMGRTPHALRRFGASPDDERAVERALVEADAADLADRGTEELSGGERQRVLMALALAQEPDLLLLDEPTLHLDLAHQVGMLETLERLRLRRGIAILAVLHDLNLAAAFAPRVVLLHDGVVAADAAPSEVLRPDLVRRVFGVAVDEALTADGRSFLAARGGASHRIGEPFEPTGAITNAKP